MNLNNLPFVGTARNFLSLHSRAWMFSALGIVIAVNILFVLAPLLRGYLSLTGRNATLAKEIAGVKYDKANEARLKATFGEAAARLAESEKLLATGDVAVYLETLSAFAQETGVRIRSLRPIEVTDPAPVEGKAPLYHRTFFEILANSGYHQAGRFVAKIENHPVLIKISRVEIRQNPESPREHDIKIDLLMVQKTPENYVAISTP